MLTLLLTITALIITVLNIIRLLSVPFQMPETKKGAYLLPLTIKQCLTNLTPFLIGSVSPQPTSLVGI